MNSHLQLDLKQPSTLWSVVHTSTHTHTHTQHGSKCLVQFFRIQSARHRQQAQENGCVCLSVSHSVNLSLCLCIYVCGWNQTRLVWICTVSKLCIHEKVCLKENSVFLYNLGGIFIVLPSTPIRYGHILLTLWICCTLLEWSAIGTGHTRGQL